MARIFRTAPTRRDLDEIWDYVAVENHSPEAADNLIDEIGRRLRLVADQPLSGESVIDSCKHETYHLQETLPVFLRTDHGRNLRSASIALSAAMQTRRLGQVEFHLPRQRTGHAIENCVFDHVVVCCPDQSGCRETRVS